MKTTRRTVQIGFVALTLAAVFLLGADAERWCPFGGVEAIYTYVQEGSMTCSLGVSNFYIMAGVLVSVLLLRRAFCGYACPIGAISELLQDGAGKLGLRPRRVPARLDSVLSLLKYPLLAVILYFTWRTAELMFRGFDPCYALISRHGQDITFWAYVVAGAIVLASLVLVMPFCRWFCPLAAVLNPFSRFGLARVQRDKDICTLCEDCNDACPMAIPVMAKAEVKEARCLSCLSCLEACPVLDQGALSFGPPRGRAWSQVLLIGILLLSLTGGVLASYAWPLPSFVRERGVPPAAPGSVELRIDPLTCRGKSTLLWSFLEREDLMALEGYLRLEAWPGAGFARARISFDPAQVDAEAVRQAITEPSYDPVGDAWNFSLFEIEGYDPLGLLEE